MLLHYYLIDLTSTFQLIKNASNRIRHIPNFEGEKQASGEW